jgi:hypothetical protein
MWCPLLGPPFSCLVVFHNDDVSHGGPLFLLWLLRSLIRSLVWLSENLIYALHGVMLTMLLSIAFTLFMHVQNSHNEDPLYLSHRAQHGWFIWS